MTSLRLSASYAAQLIACPGSAHLDLSIPGWVPPVVDDTVGARGVGSQLHELLDTLSQLPPSQLVGLTLALNYLNELRSRRRFKMETEVKTEMDWLVTKPNTTVDVVLWVQDELHILDWKTGKIPVSPVNNAQLMTYALCHLDKAPRCKEIHLHIVQPWAGGNMEEWIISRADLLVFKDQLIETEKKILAKDTTLTPSDNCTFCPAYPHSRGDKGRPFCPAAMQLLYPSRFNEADILAL